MRVGAAAVPAGAAGRWRGRPDGVGRGTEHAVAEGAALRDPHYASRATVGDGEWQPVKLSWLRSYVLSDGALIATARLLRRKEAHWPYRS